MREWYNIGNNSCVYSTILFFAIRFYSIELHRTTATTKVPKITLIYEINSSTPSLLFSVLIDLISKSDSNRNKSKIFSVI